jgi:hypothetical protein
MPDQRVDHMLLGKVEKLEQQVKVPRSRSPRWAGPRHRRQAEGPQVSSGSPRKPRVTWPAKPMRPFKHLFCYEDGQATGWSNGHRTRQNFS